MWISKTLNRTLELMRDRSVKILDKIETRAFAFHYLRKKMGKSYSYVSSIVFPNEDWGLQMRKVNLNFLEDFVVPPGYQVRTYRKGDEESWKNIVVSSFIKGYDAWHPWIDEIVNAKDFDPESLFFATYNGRPVGTACALRKSLNQQNVGYVHMVGVIPEHRRKKLGSLLVLFTLRYFRQKCIDEVFLYTQAHRLPAIKMYLNLGFRPTYIEPNDERFWSKIFMKLRGEKINFMRN